MPPFSCKQDFYLLGALHAFTLSVWFWCYEAVAVAALNLVAALFWLISSRISSLNPLKFGLITYAIGTVWLMGWDSGFEYLLILALLLEVLEARHRLLLVLPMLAFCALYFCCPLPRLAMVAPLQALYVPNACTVFLLIACLVQARLQDLLQQSHAERWAARTDSLTQALNRRGFWAALQEERRIMQGVLVLVDQIGRAHV